MTGFQEAIYKRSHGIAVALFGDCVLSWDVIERYKVFNNPISLFDLCVL